MTSVVVAVALDLTAASAAVVLSFGGAGFAASYEDGDVVASQPNDKPRQLLPSPGVFPESIFGR